MSESEWRQPTEQEHELLVKYMKLKLEREKISSKKLGRIFLILVVLFAISIFVSSSIIEKVFGGIIAVCFFIAFILTLRPNKIDIEDLKEITNRKYEVYLTYIEDIKKYEVANKLVAGYMEVYAEYIPNDNAEDRDFVICSYKMINGEKREIELGDPLLILKFNNNNERYEAFTDYMLLFGGIYSNKPKSRKLKINKKK